MYHQIALQMFFKNEFKTQKQFQRESLSPFLGQLNTFLCFHQGAYLLGMLHGKICLSIIRFK